ncbi:glycosyltransferase [Arthrobacter sp. RT-1]|uniref:glycosyltransferase family 2 protein n=1 Tax=Arthrobacter sp. RT-1 TaxID=2292263 RepID=UPI000E1F37C8|nr:glycosyltransferase family 2 protein [Arthrobacter sp. RT-1]RDV08113.1 glycosyltransferase [Arthrobacter sp. RT-1]
MMVSITVLTPSFNYGQYLHVALNSVTLPGCPVEHVVMDAESTDGTSEVLAASAQSVIWRSQPDSGQSDALNKALKLSSGDVIGWLNADDFYLPSTLQLVMKHFKEDPALDVLYGDTVLVDADGRILRLLKAYRRPGKVIEWRGPVFLSTATFYRRKVLGEDPFDVRMKMLMDWDIFLTLVKNDALKFKYLPVPLAAFRMHELQVTHNRSGYKSPEHSLLRQKHHIDERLVPLTRRLGVALHRANKLARGAWLPELLVAHRLRGRSLLTSAGQVDVTTAKDLMKTAHQAPFQRLLSTLQGGQTI